MRNPDVAGYTRVNLKDDVEDMAPKFGLAPGLESRFARVPLELRNAGLSYFKMAPGFRVPFGHVHSEQEEAYLVISGSARIKLDDEIVEARQWDVVRVAPGVWRGMEGGSEGAEIVAFGAPNTENKDSEMVQGWWDGEGEAGDGGRAA
jgi:mannose-6-phosphate isomerase-like protein (cupin superfamily)